MLPVVGALALLVTTLVVPADVGASANLTGVTQIAAGESFTCAVVAGGQVRCWGLNDNGQLGNGSISNSLSPVGVTGLSGATQVAAGKSHACALVAGGQVRCWGNNSFGQLGNNSTATSPTVVAVTGLSGATQIAAGLTHTCALVAGGQVRCWGGNLSGQLGNNSLANSSTFVSVTGLSGATKITAGGLHTCALVAGGQARCWGLNDSGQLGNNSQTNSSTLVSVTGLSGATQISAGTSHTCAIVAGGQARCWGLNNGGQVGNGLFQAVTKTPVAVGGLSGATALATGSRHSCALVANGQVRCWGSDEFGQLGDGTPGTPSSVFVAVAGLTGGTHLAGGGDHTCTIVADAQVRCWGTNGSGQLGNGASTGTVPTPLGVPGVSGVTRISAGGSHTCALVAGGQVRCWGSNVTGQLGIGSSGPALAAPTPVAGLSGATRIAAGPFHTCALVAGGQARCWGLNTHGQLGNGVVGGVFASPVAVIGLSGATRIAVGKNHSCAIVAGGQVRCWGLDTAGQLGDGAATSSQASQPVSVSGLAGATELAAAGDHTCAAVTGGQGRCWGQGSSGQLGDGSTSGSQSPVSVTGLSGATRLALGSSHSCAVVAGGQVRCWGANSSAQLGNGVVSLPVPTITSVTGITSATEISAQFDHTCVLVSGGQGRCWGRGFEQQLGNAVPFIVAPNAVAVTGLSGATQISAGSLHTCAEVSGLSSCWGSNQSDQVGVLNGAAAPVAVIAPV